MQIGGYVIQERDVPIYQVGLDEAGSMTVRALPAGTAVRCPVYGAPIARLRRDYCESRTAPEPSIS